MNIQSVTANVLPAAAVQPGDKAPVPVPPEVKAGNLPAAETRQAENTPAPPPGKPEDEREIREAVDNIQKFVAQSTRDITFSIDKEAGFMVKVIDRTSQDVIRQIPSEEVVAIARALDKLQGLFVRDKI